MRIKKQRIIATGALSLVWSIAVSAEALRQQGKVKELGDIIKMSASADTDEEGAWIRSEIDSEMGIQALDEGLIVPSEEMDEIDIESGYNIPKPRSLTGTDKTLACIGISYSKSKINDYVTASVCKKLATNVAEFYDRNSGGRLKLIPVGYQMEFEGSPWNDFSRAEVAAKAKFKANYYIIPSIFRKGGNHASGGVAHLTQLTGWVATHEVGHLLGFGHTGRYSISKTGKVSLDPYGDTDSVMSKTGSKFLTAPQYYYRGWLDKNEVAVYDGSSSEFELKQISNQKGEGTAIIVIDQSVTKQKDRSVYVAFSSSCKTGCAALYLANGGSTQKVGFSYTELKDERFTNLDIKVLGYEKGKVRISIGQIGN